MCSLLFPGLPTGQCLGENGTMRRPDNKAIQYLYRSLASNLGFRSGFCLTALEKNPWNGKRLIEARVARDCKFAVMDIMCS